MPKPVKKAVRKLKTPPKPQRPSDPNRAAHAQIAEHLERMNDQSSSPSFEDQLSAHMAKLGSKGGKISGAKRMEMPEAKRRAIALKAARARWAKALRVPRG